MNIFNPLKWLIYQQNTEKFHRNEKRLKNGMSFDDVKLILGSPSKILQDEDRIIWDFELGIYYGLGLNGSYIHREKKHRLSISFKNNKIESKWYCYY